ncbi:MAG: D-alanyl-D-alanine carboxypeptidase/D-alanyl-D-alanine endopeptidase [Bdellovibrionota bacterium]
MADEFASLLSATKQKVGFYLYDIENNRVLSSYKETRPLRPASLLKILTSYGALRTLGPEHTFTTKVFVEGHRGSHVERLIVKGGGDPSFSTESLWKLAREIKKARISKINTIVLDDSLYLNLNERGGERAYQAKATALPLNYNSIEFKVCPRSCGMQADVSYDPFEYGINFDGKIITDSKKHFYQVDELKTSPNTYTLSGNIKCMAPCDTFYRSIDDPLLYFTQVFYEFLSYLDISASKKFLASVKSDNGKLLFSQSSLPLKEILVGLNHYSVNVTANHLVYAIGKTDIGKSFNVGLGVLNKVARDFGCTSCNIVDGSGLDHKNLLSAKVLGNILNAIAKSPSISAEFESSLPTMGRSGTLKKVNYLPQSVVLRAKTGTINGVRGLAGYIYSRRGKKYTFVIMQDGADYVSAVNLERKLVNLINNRINRN